MNLKTNCSEEDKNVIDNRIDYEQYPKLGGGFTGDCLTKFWIAIRFLVYLGLAAWG